MIMDTYASCKTFLPPFRKLACFSSGSYLTIRLVFFSCKSRFTGIETIPVCIHISPKKRRIVVWNHGYLSHQLNGEAAEPL